MLSARAQRAIFTLMCQLGLRGLHYQLLCTEDNEEVELQNRRSGAPARVKKAIESWIEWSLQISDLVSVGDPRSSTLTCDTISVLATPAEPARQQALAARAQRPVDRV